MNPKFTYFALLAGSILFPFLYSFDKRIAFYKRWSALFIAISCVAAFFISWDVWFTSQGVWSFNNNYVTGIYLFGLPLEEWLFFVFIPYACIFIYDSMKYFIKGDPLKPIAPVMTFLLSGILLFLSFFYAGKIYTQVTFLMAAIFLIIHYLIFGNKFLGKFYIAYFIHLIPFFSVNGILTYLPVVLYNNDENLGIRVGTVPIEDSIYSLLLLLMNVTIYEFLNERKTIKDGVTNVSGSVL